MKYPLAGGCAGLLVVSLLALVWLDQRWPMRPVPAASSVVVARDGTPLRAFPGADGQWRYPISNDQVSPRYLSQLLAYEDRWFYWHPGVNPLALLRAAWQNLRAGRVLSGGSTLTMQVARLLYPHERTLLGKSQQMLRALQLEWHLSKAEILNAYLNLAPFGGMLSGVQVASYRYFAKPASRLSDAEAALLVVLPQRPSYLRPDRHPLRARVARDKVLQRMVDYQHWSVLRVREAQAEPLSISRQGMPVVAPLLSRRLYLACQPPCTRIQSTLDYNLQRQLEQLAEQYRQQLSEQHSLAIMVMDNRDGQVHGYVGSADFWSQERQGQVDMIQAVRSPGSTLKPFLYGLAIDVGLIHDQSLLLDTPRHGSHYRPGNFSASFSGPVSARAALQRSLNVPAVQLLSFFGAGRFLATLQHAGLATFGPGSVQPNEAIILGGIGVRLQELLGLYSSLARQGVAVQPRFQPQQLLHQRYLMSPGAAWITWDMLAHPPHGRLAQHTRTRWNLAWKTGTSYGYREAWALGVGSRWSIGVWVGRPDGNPSPGRYGRVAAAPLLFRVHAMLAGNQPRLVQPASVTEQVICWPLGSRANRAENQGDNCLQRRQAYLLGESAPLTLAATPGLQLAGLLRSIWVDQASGLRVEPACAPAPDNMQQRHIAIWPAAAQPWLPAAWRQRSRLPAMHPNCAALVTAQQPITITSYPEGAQVRAPAPVGKVTLKLLAEGGSGDRDWYLNGHYLGRSQQGLTHEVRRSGHYQISVMDQQGNTAQRQIEVNLTTSPANGDGL